MGREKVMMTEDAKARGIPAHWALKIAATFQASLGAVAVALALRYFQSPSTRQPPKLALLICGVSLLLIGLGGPRRTLRKKIHLPPEILATIRVQAIGLPALGAGLLVGAAMGTSVAAGAAYLGFGVGMVLLAYLGFFRLSQRMPATFYLSEMLVSIRSGGITGAAADSPMHQAFQRWSPGSADGVPVGAEAPDGPVVTLTGERLQLRELIQQDDRPLVLNLGSYTCPHHRKRLPELQALRARWAPKGVRFLTVYIAEAHPEDGWTLADQYVLDAEFTQAEDFCFFYAKTLADRQAMAEFFVASKQVEMDVVLDEMGDTLLTQYNAWPIRLYVIQSGRVVYAGDQGPFGYDVPAVEAALVKLAG